MNPYFELIRPNICLLSVFGLIVGLLLIEIPLNFWIFPVLAVFLISASGNVVNDYFDFEIDKINKPKRPLPSGRISKNKVLILYLVLVFSGLFISFFVSLNFLFLALFNSFLVFVYSLKFKKTLLGNFVDSWLACSVFIAPIFIFGGLAELIISSATILGLISFFGNYGREILKDVEDIKGDQFRKLKTLPIVLDGEKATIIGKLFIFIGSVFLFLPYFLQIFGLVYLISAIICFSLCLYILTIKDITVAQKLTKVMMFIVIFSFLIGLILI